MNYDNMNSNASTTFYSKNITLIHVSTITLLPEEKELHI